ELPHGYDLSVATTLEMSFNKLSNRSKEALRIFSFLQHNSIAHRIIAAAGKNKFFYASGKASEADNDKLDAIKAQAENLCRIFCPKGQWSEIEFHKIVEPCFQYSLLQPTTSIDGQKFYSMHILVQSWLQLQSFPEDRFPSKALTRRLLLAVAEDDLSLQRYELHQMLLPHIRPFTGVPLDVATDEHLLYQVLDDAGDFPTADVHLTAYLDMLKDKLVWDSRERLNGLHLHTCILMALGRDRDSLEAGKEATELCTKAFGREDPLTLTLMSNVGSAYLNLGQHEKAQGLMEEILTLRKKVLGLEHPDTFTAMSNLASCYWQQGLYQKAEEIDTEVLALRKR
ncbi:574_t:CDS:1, partial [Acaulospora colombiana]